MKIVFAGCSVTAGTGWADGDDPDEIKTSRKHPNLWVNLCCNNIEPFRNLELLNQAQGGESNTEIFQQCIAIMAEHGNNIDTLFCQWTAMPRYNFNVGFEPKHQIPYRCVGRTKTHVTPTTLDKWPREYIVDLMDRIMVLHHLHWEILHVVEYTNHIKKLAKKLGINRVFFVNGLCPWDNNFFDCLENVLPESYTPFTKEFILDWKSRPDEDIRELYTQAHMQYQQAGGIDPGDWINLYSSFKSNKIDFNFDGRHPGKQSNLLYYDLVCKKIQDHTNFSA